MASMGSTLDDRWHRRGSTLDDRWHRRARPSMTIMTLNLGSAYSCCLETGSTLSTQLNIGGSRSSARAPVSEVRVSGGGAGLEGARVVVVNMGGEKRGNFSAFENLPIRPSDTLFVHRIELKLKFQGPLQTPKSRHADLDLLPLRNRAEDRFQYSTTSYPRTASQLLSE